MQTEGYTIKCIERAVHYMSDQISEDNAPSLNDIAIESGLSKFHFHRIYRLTTGETCAQTITRLRLARGANTLKDNRETITSAAMTAGYGSSQAFAKALKKTLDQTATELKTDPERLASAVHTLSEPLQKNAKGGTAPVRIELCSLDPFEVLVIRTKDTYPVLNSIYWYLVEVAESPENIKAVLGIAQRDIETYQNDGFLFDCALAFHNPAMLKPNDVERKNIDGGLYLIIRNIGPDDQLPDTLDRLYEYVLHNQQINFSDQPCFFHYVDDPEEVPESECRTDIYLKIEQDMRVT